MRSRIYAISDIHESGLSGVDPSGHDIVVIAGDFMGSGYWFDGRGNQWLRYVFFPWCERNADKEIVVIPGNHDRFLGRWFNRNDKPGFPPNVHYLIDGECVIDGIRFYGTPWCAWHHGGAFEVEEAELAEKFAKIPEGVDVLVTHTPPRFGEVDAASDGRHFGSEALAREIMRKKPKIVICGHIHSGSHIPAVNNKGTVIVNVARVDGDRGVAEHTGRSIEVMRDGDGQVIGFRTDGGDDCRIGWKSKLQGEGKVNDKYGKSFPREFVGVMDGAVRGYLRMVSVGDEGLRRHADGTVCEAKSPETCPFERRAESADRLDGRSGANAEVKSVDEIDREYADAVNRGDRDTALKMIREAAARAMPNTKVVDKDGLPLVVWHQTNKDFTKFDTANRFGSSGGRSEYIFPNCIYLKATDEHINVRGNKQMRLFANSNNLVVVPNRTSLHNYWRGVIDGFAEKEDILNSMRNDLMNKLRYSQNPEEDAASYKVLYDRIARQIKRMVLKHCIDNEIDGIIVENDMDVYEIAILSPYQIKSADITYDDDKNLIPLSKRFNFKSADIRDEARGKILAYLRSVEDETIKEHDARYHPNGFNPKTDSCEFRERRAKLDPVDSDVAEGGISGIYTGSAANYNRPSLMHVGTGEGSQVYGWGLYGSNVRGVAEGYAVHNKDKTGMLNNDVELAKNWVSSELENGLSLHDALLSLKERGRNSISHRRAYNVAKEFENNWNEIDDVVVNKGCLYSQTFFTNRAPGDESHLLNWYEPVSAENARRIIKAIEQVSEQAEDPRDIEYVLSKGWRTEVKSWTGQKAYEELWDVCKFANGGGAKEASEALARADIDGIKYPVDSYGGKDIKDGDKVGWNYVSFRDDNIRTDRKFVDGVETPVKDALK